MPVCSTCGCLTRTHTLRAFQLLGFEQSVQSPVSVVHTVSVNLPGGVMKHLRHPVYWALDGQPRRHPARTGTGKHRLQASRSLCTRPRLSSAKNLCQWNGPCREATLCLSGPEVRCRCAALTLSVLRVWENSIISWMHGDATRGIEHAHTRPITRRLRADLLPIGVSNQRPRTAPSPTAL
ncbi:hypothetical protein LX36DRAFT_21657 [Colletotrichum falcatum]|nr:hypothetical protein LX36DRAFT_21657 [Colletotrichum falcatum]